MTDGPAFSRAACRDTSAIGKSTSARRLQSLGIMRLFRQAASRRAPDGACAIAFTARE